MAVRVLAFLFALVAGCSATQAQLSMLHTSGRNIVNANGSTVVLNGVNLGGLMVMEKWMTPADSEATLPDTYSIIQELDNRFGVAEEQSLIRDYQQAWITPQDFVNIKNAGFNVVRVPVWWGNFYPLANISNAAWRSDAFTELDWIVNQAAAQGIYVIIDMHGAVGGQSTSGDTGQQNLNAYWTNGSDQGNTAFMWWQIANHYKDNPTVAGYDLLNEPMNAPNNAAVISAYASLYTTVRSVDPAHIVIMESCFGNWNWSMLPDPSSEGWSNVVYEMHEYQYGGTQAQVEAGSANQVTDFNNYASYNTPDYIGEWNDMGYPAAAYQYSYGEFLNNGISSTMWSYKGTGTLNPNGWALYGPTQWAATPNIVTDSASTIAADWAQWSTANAFAPNTTLGFNIPTGTVYNIVNQNSGLCLDATGWGTADGTTLQQYACGGGSYSTQANQEWEFQSAGNGNYYITNVNAPSEAWNVVNSGTSSGSLMQLWSYSSTANKQWSAISLGNGYYKFVGVGSGLCLDVPSASTKYGVQMQIYTCNGTAAQSFKLVTP